MANEPTLDEALQAAHLPALAVALVQRYPLAEAGMEADLCAIPAGRHRPFG